MLLRDDRISVTDYPSRRVVDESARRGPPSCPVDLLTIDYPNRRDRGGPNPSNLYALRNQRASNKHQFFFHLFLPFCSLFGVGVCQCRSDKRADGNKNRDASRK